MASFVLIRHKVRDFSEWKRGYDAHLPKRTEAGLTEKHLLRGANDPNEVVLLLEAKDQNRAKAFVESANPGKPFLPGKYFEASVPQHHKRLFDLRLEDQAAVLSTLLCNS